MENKSSGYLCGEQIFLLIGSFTVIFASWVLLAIISLIFLPLKLLRLSLKAVSARPSVSFPIVIIAVFLGTVALLNRPGPTTTKTEIVIRRGMSASQIADVLYTKGIISNRSFFMLVAKLSGLEKDFKAGKYHFAGATSSLSALRKLKSGGALIQQVTIPEGLTSNQIAGILQENTQVDSIKFVNLVHNPDLARKLGINAPSLEGYLFPDTYRFYWGTSEEKIIEIMVKRFHQIFTDSLKQRAARLRMTTHQVITLASIIEKEAQVPEEKPLISEVFHRRLKLGMPLQADPTVIYALNEHPRRLSKADTRVKSPYNTYLHRGLPPGPICNPGKSSILAALYPAKTNYLYFVAKGDGTHIFTKTFAAHIRAKNRIKRMRKYGYHYPRTGKSGNLCDN